VGRKGNKDHPQKNPQKKEEEEEKKKEKYEKKGPGTSHIEAPARSK